MDPDKAAQLVQKIIDVVLAEGGIKDSVDARMVTKDIAILLAHMTVAVGLRCFPENLAMGIDFVHDEFLAEIQHKCEQHGIAGIQIVFVDKEDVLNGKKTQKRGGGRIGDC